MRILAIIPARGGSKGIKDKNIVLIKGKPLLAYTAIPALSLREKGVLNDVILSTDSSRIAEVGKELGLHVPFLRPAEFATDKAKAISYVIHALDFYEEKGVSFDGVMILQPTSPLRSMEDIEHAVNIFQQEKSDSLISVYEEAYINDLVMYRFGENGHLGNPLNPLHNKGVRRQDHGSVYVRNGCIYITRTKYIRDNELIISDNPLLYVMTKEQSVNVDTPEDLNLLKKVL